MTTMDTQIDYSDNMMLQRQQCLLSLGYEFGFGRDVYEFCTDWVLDHTTTQGIKEAYKEYETQRPNQINQVGTQKT
jgi:hypothetical protein|tara:strand:- start:266 stop:493 length:228 start_codon:yes stop_codon:yes gene_type:complete